MITTSLPEREPGDKEVVIEAEHVTTSTLLHDGETHGIRIPDRARGQPLQPTPRGGVLVRSREPDRDVWTGIEEVERNVTRDRLSEQTVRLGMVLVASAAKRDPRPAIDEQSCGSGCARGTLPVARQRRSR